MPPDIGNLLMVVWKDHEDHTSAEWLSYEDASEQVKKPVAQIHSVGWIYHENKETISLVATLGPEECSGVLRILKSAIVRRLDLMDDAGTIFP